MKNAFYFILKALFSRYINFCFNFLVKKLSLIRNIRLFQNLCHNLVNKYKTNIANISRNTSNQTMKFDQLLEYNTRNIFLQKSCGKGGDWGRETSSGSLCFWKKLLWVKTKCSAAQFQYLSIALNCRLLIQRYDQF